MTAGAICLGVLLVGLVLAFVIDVAFARWEPGDNDDT